MFGYVTLEEANEYITSRYITDDPKRIAWEDLNKEDQQSLLNSSADAINSLVVPGRKTYPDSPNIFPRWPNTEVDDRIKFAQIENAVAINQSDDSIDTYRKMRAYGIAHYSIGNLSETMVQWGGSNMDMLLSGIVSDKAQSFLKPFMGGSFCI